MGRKRLRLDQLAHNPLGIEPRLRLGMVARCGAGKREARHACGEPAHEHAADGTEAGDSDAGHRHEQTLGTISTSRLALTRPAHPSKAGEPPPQPSDWTSICPKDKSVGQSGRSDMLKSWMSGMLKSAAGACGILLAITGTTLSQTYPARPMTMIIPFAAGGPTDVLGRVMAQRMSEILGQQIVVENVGGAGGMTGSKRVADAAPDGYSFVLGTVGTHAQSQTMYKKPLYHATDFTPVALIAEVPIVLISRRDLPVNDLPEFIAYAKANQTKMQYGSAGAGSATHLGCVLLNYLIGVDITHVPYRGTGPAMQDLQGGRIDYLCEIVSTAKPQIDGGTVKPIAIMTKERSKALPNVPTGLEQGTPDLEAYTWNAIFLPKGAPADIVKKLNDAAVEAMKTPTVKERLEGLGAVIVSDDRATPEYLGQFLKSEIEKWAGPIKASGVTVD